MPTSIYEVPLTTAAALAERLEVDPPAADTAAAKSWADAILDASNQVRDAVGQPITARTDTVILDVADDGWAQLPFVPVRAVTAVVIGPVALASGSWRLDSDRRNVYVGGWGPQATVTVDHGWVNVPGELLRWVWMLAAARIAAVGTGTLGMGGAKSVAVDDGSVTFDTSSAAATIPDDDALRLRKNYGGGL